MEPLKTKNTTQSLVKVKSDVYFCIRTTGASSAYFISLPRQKINVRKSHLPFPFRSLPSPTPHSSSLL